MAAPFTSRKFKKVDHGQSDNGDRRDVGDRYQRIPYTSENIREDTLQLGYTEENDTGSIGSRIRGHHGEIYRHSGRQKEGSFNDSSQPTNSVRGKSPLRKSGKPYAEQSTKNVLNSDTPERAVDPVGFGDTNSAGHPPFWYEDIKILGERERELSRSYSTILRRFIQRRKPYAEKL